jgi:hypothetical protein
MKTVHEILRDAFGEERGLGETVLGCRADMGPTPGIAPSGTSLVSVQP